MNNSAIYKVFTKQNFATQALRVRQDKEIIIDKSFDLETSFYNYCLDLAYKMWEYDKTSVPVANQYYPYPKRDDEN